AAMSQKKDDLRQEILDALLESENRYRMIFDYINDGIIIHDSAGNIFDVNQTMHERLGYAKSEMLKMSLQDLVSPEFARNIKKNVKKLKEEGVAIFESADKRKDGTYMPVEISARYVDYKGKKLIQSVVRDIQERTLAEELISANLREKEALLGEIQSRTKFDNQVFTMILQQLKKLDDPQALENSIEKQRKRLLTLRFIQNKIYQHKNPLQVNFGSVLPSLSRYIYNLYPPKDKTIDIQVNCENARLDMPTSMNCAQIISELLSNALLHGFDGQTQGSIELSSHQSQNGKHIIRVADNGVGFPEELDFFNVQTIGLQVVTSLVEKLSGKIRMDRKAGTTFQVIF
ncbi:MAG: PAS domain S-box protein, partial [Candidatus Aminicenantes bacterium]|nr:PAS domain S-box protein [Candidatus Aminicenantes bacterium]